MEQLSIQFEVRDMRHKEKFEIDDIYLNGHAKKCGIYATGVYMALCRHANKEQYCWPSIKKIAEELNISDKQVGRAVKILEKNRIIIKRRSGKKMNNRYVLLDKSEWTTSPISEQTDSPITTDPQSDHIGTDSPIHSKESHIRTTHIRDIFNFWNEQNIIVHSKLTDKIKTKIISTLKDYSQKDILLAIRKYKIVLDGSEYFWTYRWTLQEFLSRGLTKFLDTPIDNFKKSNGFEKPKKEKRYYQGNPVVSKNGKDYVISGGEWLEFAGEDKDIEVRYE